jgi:16S rRNA G966 N2-methylase RsmD
MSVIQTSLFPEMDIVSDNSSTFEDNMKMPIHRWYRYTAGFSASWVAQLLEKEGKNKHLRVIDPFVGSGTVALESVFHNVDAIGFESNPYVNRIANAKLAWRTIDIENLKRTALKVLSDAKTSVAELPPYPSLIERCYPKETLSKLHALKMSWKTITEVEYKDFIWFIITSILRCCSPVGTAQWQYIQPNKSKSKVIDPFTAFSTKLEEILSDIAIAKRKETKSNVSILMTDAREDTLAPSCWADLVITSPPYANNYDYADAMRLEMLFWGEDDNYYNQQVNVKSQLVRACTQHVGKLKNDVHTLINSELLSPIHDELVEVYQKLEEERSKHGGKKNYHFMITAYFYDLAKVFKTLYRVTKDESKMCFVIGDSAPYGIYVPVDEWLGKLAIAAGFKDYEFEKLRDRNIKWKNRKHRVPLKEGRLWIKK